MQFWASAGYLLHQVMTSPVPWPPSEWCSRRPPPRRSSPSWPWSPSWSHVRNHKFKMRAGGHRAPALGETTWMRTPTAQRYFFLSASAVRGGESTTTTTITKPASESSLCQRRRWLLFPNYSTWGTNELLVTPWLRSLKRPPSLWLRSFDQGQEGEEGRGGGRRLHHSEGGHGAAYCLYICFGHDLGWFWINLHWCIAERAIGRPARWPFSQFFLFFVLGAHYLFNRCPCAQWSSGQFPSCFQLGVRFLFTPTLSLPQPLLGQGR